ncbi:hypothetical protein CRYUN_Cryun13aG0064400 [Craigia yunnanensis]
MADNLEEMWRRFSLTEEEQTDVVIEKEWVENTSEKSKNWLLGKMVMKRNVNMEATKVIFTKLWKIREGMSVQKVGERLFIF